MPFQIKGVGNDIVLLKKHNDHFRSVGTCFAYFVPLAGAYAGTGKDPFQLDELPFWPDIRNRECMRQPAWFAGGVAETFALRTRGFRSFLTKTEPRLRVLGGDVSAFAVVDTDARSVALCEPLRMVGYGDKTASDALLQGYRAWGDPVYAWCRGLQAFGVPIQASSGRSETWVAG